MSAAFFILNDDVLIVANGGNRFSREGVISICNMDLSAKEADTNRTPEDIYSDADDATLVDHIRERRLGEYKNDINRLIEDVNREHGVETNYTGRFVWELIQNADDAADDRGSNTQLIGTKGLGFKSVLEICNEPEIYSGDFCFHFSREKSRKALNEIPNWQEETGIPICRLPHTKERDEEVQELLNNGYASVIRLPLKEGAKEKVVDELSKLHGTSLLFCQRLASVAIQTGRETRHIAVDRLQQGHDAGEIKLIEDNNTEHWRVWRKTAPADSSEKQISVGVCLPVVNGRASACDEESPLSVFFPTKERTEGIHAMIHASCAVDDSRKHLSDKQPHAEEIHQLLKTIIIEILEEITADAALGAFGKTTDKNNSMAEKLGGTIRNTVQEMAFVPVIGGGKKKPKEVRLWKYGLGNALHPDKVRNKNLCTPDLQSKEGQGILKSLGAEDLSTVEHAALLEFCLNRTDKECLATWHVAQSLAAESENNDECIAALRKAPFWRTTEGKARAIDGNIPLLRHTPKDWPDWIAMNIIDKKFSKDIQDEERRHKEKNHDWQNALDKNHIKPLEKKMEYFNDVLLPHAKDQPPVWWKKNGWRILKMAFQWGQDDNDEEIILCLGQSDKTETFITGKPKKPKCRHPEIIHLPVGRNAQEWQPAWQVYAGTAWDGPKIFDKYFANNTERQVLAPMDKWNIEIKDKSKMKGLLSWFGCSWMPKMVHTNLTYTNLKHPFRKDTPKHSQWNHEYHFEYFDEMLPHLNKSNFTSLLKVTPKMYKSTEEKKAEYVARTNPHKCDSYAIVQLKKNPWVHCKPSLLSSEERVKPADAYLPGCGLSGLLPEVDKSDDLDERTWQEVQRTLEKFGTHTKMPDDEGMLIGYMNKLSEYTDRHEKDFRWSKDKKGKIAQAAKAVFDAYQKNSSPSPLRDRVIKVPCLTRTDQGERIYFEAVDNAYWADKPYFAKQEVRREILQLKNISVFFMFLDDGKKFGLKLLSEHLEMNPEYGEECLENTQAFRRRYTERRIALTKVAKASLPKALELTAYKCISVRTATLAIRPEVQFWNEGENAIAVNAGSEEFDKWQCLAAAISEAGDCSQHKSDFENLLREKDKKKFLARLRNSYGLTEESLKEVEADCATPDTDSQPQEENPPVTDTDKENKAYSSGKARNQIKTLHQPSVGTYTDSNTPQHAYREPDVPATTQHIPDLKEEEYVWPASNYGGGPGGGYGGDPDERKKTGSKGEKTLLKWLRCEYGNENVRDMNEEKPDHPGYDILVTKNGQEYYYECKSFPSTPDRRVSLSNTQWECAKEKGERYILCIVYNLNEDTANMLPPIPDPTTLKAEPVTTEYKLDLTTMPS